VSVYRYILGDPRESRSHYQYSPFEGIDLLRNWAVARSDLMTKLRREDNVAPVMDLPPQVGTRTIASETDLRACAAALVHSTAPLSLLEDWSRFAQRKIDIAHRLTEQYGLDGRTTNAADAKPAAYAFAAYILAWRMTHADATSDRLKWLNALLKCNDILSVASKGGLDDFAASCGYRALQSEHEQVVKEAARLGIIWQ
jgi:hypothetical protein